MFSNVVLVSAVQGSESAICTHTAPLSHAPLPPLPPHLSRRALS